MSYSIQLTKEELGHLLWLVGHGYFPEAAYQELVPGDGQDTEIWEQDPNALVTWTLPEWAAWSIVEQREQDPDSLFACTGGPLLDKLLALEQGIV